MYVAKYQDFNVDGTKVSGNYDESASFSTPEEAISWIVASCKGDGSDLKSLGKGCFRERYSDEGYREFLTYELKRVSIEISVTEID